MTQITFPKIEIEPNDLDRLDTIVSRFETAVRVVYDGIPSAINLYDDEKATIERQNAYMEKLRDAISYCIYMTGNYTTNENVRLALIAQRLRDVTGISSGVHNTGNYYDTEIEGEK